MLKELKKLILYGGLEREDYISILPDIHSQNQRDLRAYCTIVAILLGVSALVVLITSTFTVTTAFVYFLGVATSLLLLCLSAYFGRFSWMDDFLKYAFMCAVYGFGILVTLAQPESLAVSFMVLLVMVPLLFSGSPAVITILSLAAATVFCVLEVVFKDPALVEVDILNAVTYGVLGVLVGIIMQRVRLQNLMQLRKIAMLSESDLLTGLKNRNSFEQNPIVYGNMQIKDIVCVYADINGLHEVNNTQGHRAGDIMLQTVAQAILKQFGRDHSYRVGGDEFVVLAFGQTPEETQQKIDRINEECLKSGYHVSFGYAYGGDAGGNLSSLIRSAEEKMYRAKAEYYSSIGHDRRRR